MPGMANATGNAASHSFAQTDEFILKGGETWPYASLVGGWVISGGSATTPNGSGYPGMYVGYDPTWQTGIVNAVWVSDPGNCTTGTTLTVQFSGGGGTSAAATANMEKIDSFAAPTLLTFVTMTSQGSGYTSNPTVGFTVTAGSCSRTPKAYADIYSPVISASGTTWGTATTVNPMFTFNVGYGTIDHLDFGHMHIYSNSDYTYAGAPNMILATAKAVTFNNIRVHDMALSSVSGYNTFCLQNNTCQQIDVAQSAGMFVGDENGVQSVVNNSIFNNQESEAGGCAALSTPGTPYSTGNCVQFTAVYSEAYSGTAVGLTFTNNLVSNWRGSLYTLGNDNNNTVAGNRIWAAIHDVGNQHGDTYYLQSGGLTYNNILEDIYSGTAAFYTEVSDGSSPTAFGFQNIQFNNVCFDIGTSTPCIGWSSEFTSSGATSYSPAPDLRSINNTHYGTQGTTDCDNAGQWFGASPTLQASIIITLRNVHCITTQAGSHWYDSNGTCNGTNGCGTWNGNANPNNSATQAIIDPENVVDTPTASASQGYTAANLYAPTLSSNDTVVYSGTNYTSLCSTNFNGLPLSNLCYDILGNARPVSGSWQAGAYYYTGTQASPATCSPTSGVVPQTVTCTNPNTGTTVACYTTNGTTPATAGNGTSCTTGTVYTTAISVSVAETIEIIAGTSTLADSTVNSYTYTQARATAPTASPTSGAVPQTVTVTNPNSGTTVVCYNFTGSPATNGDGATCPVGSTPYTTSLTISVPETLYIVAGTSTETDSSINSYTYTGTTPATPTFAPPAGTYTSAQNVVPSSVTPGVIICYNFTGSPATNGSTGCTTGTLFNTTSIAVTTSETLYAVAGGTGYSDSSVGSAAYVINTASFAVLNPTALTFPTTQVSVPSATQTVVLSNTGGASLNIASIGITGDYSKTTTCGATLSQGFSCNIVVTFTPTTTGTRTGVLTVTDDSGGTPGSTQTASLTGVGATILNGVKFTTGIKLTSGIAFSVAGAAAACGPPMYSCFNQSTSVVNLQNPIPSWGANTCNSTTIYTLATCGNLVGAGTARTPTDFNNTGIRVTDINTNGNPNTLWETADDPGVGLWNTDDSGFLGHINSGSFFVFSFNGSAATLVTPNISFSGAVTFSNVHNNYIYSMAGNSAVLKQNIINFSTGGVTTTTLFDYSGTNCLTNPINGYTGGVFPVTWNGQLSTDLMDNTFAMGFSTNGGQGTGQYMAVWQRGQVGCDLWRTDNGTITHNGAAFGNLSNAQWGGANGGLADFSLIHDEATTLNPNYVNIGFTQNAFIQGTYSVGPYLWQVGTTNILHCGIGAPNWVASHAYAFGTRVNPLTNNAGDYIYQIILNANVGTSGGSAPTWNQTPGGTQIDGTITWQNVGLGTSSGAQYNCDGHGWKGATGVGVGKNVTYHTFANPAVPLLGTVPTAVTSITDTHLGATNGNASDTTWPLDVSTDVGTSVNQLGTLPAALYNEMFLVSPPNQSPGVQNCVYNAITCPGGTLQQLRRAHHTYNSGWEWSFDAVQGICIMSQTGKYDLCATDGLGQFGNRSGAPSCNIGGPDWNASDSTDYSVGELVYPQSANGGDYIYKIQSCSGTCTTGSAHPTWVQSSTVTGVGTFTDGTITWQGAPDINTSTNTAVQNCRSDLVVWKLYR
jgi:hypothetical protein